MLLYDKVKYEMERQVTALRTMQQRDGTWRFCFEGPPLTDCMMIFLLRMLRKEKEIEPFVARLTSLQANEGTWKLYEDEPNGNLSATIQVYAALLASQQYKKEEQIMRRAEQFIREQGGIANAHFMTKLMLALYGQYNYPPLLHFPMTFFFQPDHSPFSMYELSNTARIHFVPTIICLNKRFVVEEIEVPDLSHIVGKNKSSWFHSQRSSVWETILSEGKRLISYPYTLHHKGYKAAERFMLERIEGNGTLYTYASATFYMIYALRALGYSIHSPIIERAVSGIQSYIWNTKNGAHLQNSPSTVWDTALLSYALQEANVSEGDAMIERANLFLVKKQHTSYGDWHVHASSLAPGGWGFTDTNTIVPDCDDTTAALRSLTSIAKKDKKVKRAWNKGIHWLLGMQNKDGGWGAFEKNVDNHMVLHIPLDSAEDMILDPSTADITGRVLEFFGTYAPNEINSYDLQRGMQWLLRNQEQNGCWYGKWGVCYIYGTWAAVTGLRANGLPKNHPAIEKAVRWLEMIQHRDGGWGESCKSSKEKRFISTSFSTPSQTAWALDALIAVYDTETPAIQNGINYLLENSFHNIEYPTGTGLPGEFYIRYHSYHRLFPLLTLAHYVKKYKK